MTNFDRSTMRLSACMLALLGGSLAFSQTRTAPLREPDFAWPASVGNTITAASGTGTSGQIMMWSSVGAAGGTLEQRKRIIPQPTLSLVKASAHAMPAARLATANYLRLAKSISLDSAATDEARVIEAIHRLEFKSYDYKRVDEYLYNIALKQGTNVRWVWKPLREIDKAATDKSGVSWQVTEGFGMLYPKIYGRALPERVLARAAELLAMLPDAVLLVSDYEVMKPDPFLAVSTGKLLGENRLWIIEQWDEPGFNEEHTVSLRASR